MEHTAYVIVQGCRWGDPDSHTEQQVQSKARFDRASRASGSLKGWKAQTMQALWASYKFWNYLLYLFNQRWRWRRQEI